METVSTCLAKNILCLINDIFKYISKNYKIFPCLKRINMRCFFSKYYSLPASATYSIHH